MCSHDRPRPGDRAAGPRRLRRRVEHRVAGPGGGGEELRLAQRRVAVQQQRRALGGVGVLVGVDRDRRDALHREGPRRHGATEPGGVGQHPPADARVDVAAHPARGGCRGDLGDRVHHAVRVRRCAGDDQHGVVVDRVGHRGRVGAEVGSDRHEHRLDAEVVRGLVERRVRRRGQHHPRPYDVRAGVARTLHRQQDRLRAAGGHRADRAVGRVEEAAREADQLVLHLQQRGERRRVEGVGGGVGGDGLAGDPVDLRVAGVVDVGQGAAAVDRQVAGLQGREALEGIRHGSFLPRRPSWPPPRPGRGCTAAATRG